MTDEYTPTTTPPVHRQVLLSPPPSPKALDVGLIRLMAPRHRLIDVLAACDEVGSWPYSRMPRPERTAIIRAKALVLAVGPLMPGGPSRVLVGPSAQGGMVTTFWGDFNDVTVATLNNRTSIIIYGQNTTAVGIRGATLHVLETTPEDALWRVQADFRPPLPSSSE